MKSTKLKPTIPEDAILAAVVWCRLGAGTYGGRRWHHPIGMFGKPVGEECFYEALTRGLLCHDSVWAATDAGEALLIDQGLVECLSCYDTGYVRGIPQRGIGCKACGRNAA